MGTQWLLGLAAGSGLGSPSRQCLSWACALSLWEAVHRASAFRRKGGCGRSRCFHANLGCPPKRCPHSQGFSQPLALDSASSSALCSDSRSPAAVLVSVLSLACGWWHGGGVGVRRSPVQERTPKHQMGSLEAQRQIWILYSFANGKPCFQEKSPAMTGSSMWFQPRAKDRASLNQSKGKNDVKHLLCLHTDCNQLPTRSSWNTKDSLDPSWLSPVMDRSNGANNLAKWWVIQKPFPFGLGRSFHAPSGRGRMRSSLPALGHAVGSGHTCPEIRLHTGEGVSSQSHTSCGHCRAWTTVWPIQKGWVQGFSMCPSLLSMLLSPARLTLPTASLGLLALRLPGRFERQEIGARKGEEARASLPASLLYWHCLSGNSTSLHLLLGSSAH